MGEGVDGVATLNGRYNSLPKLSDFCFLKGAFEAVVLCLRHISQSLEQGVSVSRTSWSRRTMTLSVPSWPPRVFPARLLRFWLYFMSPNCDWPSPPLASFHPSHRGSDPSCWAGASRPISVGCPLTWTITGRWGTCLKFILPLGGMALNLPPPVRRGQRLPSPLALQPLFETT